MTTLKFIFINLIAKIGSCCCLTAIKLSGCGYLDFEVTNSEDSTLYSYQLNNKITCQNIANLIQKAISFVLACFFVGMFVLTILDSIFK